MALPSKGDDSMTGLMKEDPNLGEFAMPFLHDKAGESSRNKSIDSLDRNLPLQTGRTDGDDSIMHSFNSDENLIESIKEGKEEMAKRMTPLNLQTYTESPVNKYIDTRSYGLPTKEEKTDDPFLDPRPKLSPLPSKENILEIECDELSDGRNTHSYSNFLKKHSCYDMIPNSTKIVVFDTRLKVKKAFFALVHNGIRSAPLWDTNVQEFVGMLTITDFINILIRYYKSPLEKMWELEEHQIETWRSLFKKNMHSTLLRISPTESLYTSCQMLMKNKIHRLPVIDEETGNAMFIITHKKILAYIYQHLDDLGMPDFLGRTIQDLSIGCYTNIATVLPTTKLIDALNIFHTRKVSALPVVDDENKCVDVYSRYDVINLAAERTYNNLDITVYEALAYRQGNSEGVHRCNPNETFYAIIERIANAKVHRLVMVDTENRIQGIVSLSDILRFLIDPPKES